jgi:hypothetical protein
VVVRSRILVLTVAVAAVLASTATASGSVKACQASQLRGHLYGSNGAAGTIIISITLTNKGSTCSMKGYARLQLMAGARRPLPTHVSHGGVPLISGKPKLVVLKHGGAASIVIAYGDVVVGNETKCETASEVLIKTPGENTWLGVVAPISACGHGGLRETPVLAGKHKAV